MRKKFVMAKSRHLAKKWCSWAVKIVKTEGGFIVFESIDDYKIWKQREDGENETGNGD